MFLNHFTDLLSIKFDKRGIRMEYNVLVKYLMKLPSGYLIDEDASLMFIKIDRLLMQDQVSVGSLSVSCSIRRIKRLILLLSN